MDMHDTIHPENTENTLYLVDYGGNLTLNDIIAAMRTHFKIAMSDYSWEDGYSIESEHIQVRCFGYDLYDASDYQNFIVIRKF